MNSICIYLGCPRTHPTTTAADDSPAAIPTSDAATLHSTAVVSPASSHDAGTEHIFRQEVAEQGDVGAQGQINTGQLNKN